MTAEYERHWVDLDTYGQVLMEVPGLTEVDEALPLVVDFREAATVD